MCREKPVAWCVGGVAAGRAAELLIANTSSHVVSQWRAGRDEEEGSRAVGEGGSVKISRSPDQDQVDCLN
jgi:hypothetical protein